MSKSPLRFYFNAHVIFPNLIALRLDLEDLTQRVAVSFTSKMLVNRNSDFRALSFLTGVDVIGDIGLSSVNPSGVDIITDSRISFNFSVSHTYHIVCI